MQRCLWSWTISGHCADRRQICGYNSSRFAYRRRPAQQLWQLGEVHRRAAGLVLGEQLGAAIKTICCRGYYPSAIAF